jgi:hypothetical protein
MVMVSLSLIPCIASRLTFDLKVSMPLNSTGMYRGVIRPDGVPKVAIFSDDELEEAPLSKES